MHLPIKYVSASRYRDIRACNHRVAVALKQVSLTFEIGLYGSLNSRKHRHACSMPACCRQMFNHRQWLQRVFNFHYCCITSRQLTSQVGVMHLVIALVHFQHAESPAQGLHEWSSRFVYTVNFQAGKYESLDTDEPAASSHQ